MENRGRIEAMRAALLGWYGSRARVLPWRGSRDPYRIWVSETMLQQTRVDTVGPYYEAFMADWPDVRALAEADQADVLKRWEGLGYYSRARNLHRAARTIMREHGGVIPADAGALLALPGVGEYTAGMVASIAYGRPEPAVDGNQVRVLSRLFRMDKPARTRDGMNTLKGIARALIDPARPGDFNQALMDLGSGICKPKNPDCGECPLGEYCLARADGDPERLPVLPARAAQRVERRGVAVVIGCGRALVQRRPDEGLLGGMWTFPNYLDADGPRAVAECLEEIGVIAVATGARADVEHVFSHLIWRQAGFAFVADGCADVCGMDWVDADGLRALAIPAAHRAFRDMALAILEG